jgi:hypothetical protein
MPGGSHLPDDDSKKLLWYNRIYNTHLVHLLGESCEERVRCGNIYRVNIIFSCL